MQPTCARMIHVLSFPEPAVGLFLVEMWCPSCVLFLVSSEAIASPMKEADHSSLICDCFYLILKLRIWEILVLCPCVELPLPSRAQENSSYHPQIFMGVHAF